MSVVCCLKWVELENICNPLPRQINKTLTNKDFDILANEILHKVYENHIVVSYMPFFTINNAEGNVLVTLEMF